MTAAEQVEEGEPLGVLGSESMKALEGYMVKSRAQGGGKTGKIVHGEPVYCQSQTCGGPSKKPQSGQIRWREGQE